MIVSTWIAIFSSLIILTSGDKNVFHDCDMFAPFSGLPLGGEGEGNRMEERAESFGGIDVASACDWPVADAA